MRQENRFYYDISQTREPLSRIVVEELLGESGWDNLAEYVVDISGVIPKPPLRPPGRGYPRDYDFHTAFCDGMHVREVEGTVLEFLQARGTNQETIEHYKQGIERYRNAVKSVVDDWRARGLL